MEILDRPGQGIGTAASRGLVEISGGAYIVGISGGSIVTTFSASELLEENDGCWTVRDLETGIFGSGADPQSAHADFDLALREHLDVLSRQPSLSADLEAQLRYLRRRVA